MQSNNDTIKQITQEDKEFVKYFSSTKTKKKLDDCLVFCKEKSEYMKSLVLVKDTSFDSKHKRRNKTQADVEDVINMRWKEYLHNK